MRQIEQEKVVMPVYKPQSLTKLLKLRCKFGSFLPGSQGEKGNLMNFMVCFFLKEKRCRVLKEKVFFPTLRIEIHFLRGPSCKGHRMIMLVTKFKSSSTVRR